MRGRIGYCAAPTARREPGEHGADQGRERTDAEQGGQQGGRAHRAPSSVEADEGQRHQARRHERDGRAAKGAPARRRMRRAPAAA